MMSPKEFMSYAGPVIILLVQQLHNWQSKKQADKTIESINAARKIAADAAQSQGQKLETVHSLVNGNLQSLKDENARLQAEIAALKQPPAPAPLAD